MQKIDAKTLLEKYKLGNCTDAERDIVETWYQKSDPEDPVQLSEEEIENSLERIRGRLNAESPARPITKLWPRIAVAAAMVVVIFGVGLFYFSKDSTRPGPFAASANDVAPGKRGATLTLANGEKIKLSDMLNGELAKEAGVTITKSADGQLVYEVKSSLPGEAKQSYNTLSTANGETYQVRLPDGSLVYLNSASSLTYAASLINDGKRVVALRGEGYFEIAKDQKHPFVVKTDKQEVEVLGTHFNINSYPDEPVVSTTLVEGSVKITSNGQQQLLKPGEQAINNGTSIKVAEANIENVIDWKQGEFYLNRVNFKTGMRKIARWYDVEVIYNASVPDDMEIGGWVSKNEKLSSVLKSIESAGLVRFRIEGRKIYVTK